MQSLEIQPLSRSDIGKLWDIERRETVEEVYVVVGGELRLSAQFYDTQDWPNGEAEAYTPILLDCFDSGGIFLGAFADRQLIAAGIVDIRPVRDYPELRQLAFLHVSHDWRGKGIAAHLYKLCAELATKAGAEGFYISSTSTRRTVEFYQRQGAELAVSPDTALFAIEPNDIHLIHRF